MPATGARRRLTLAGLAVLVVLAAGVVVAIDRRGPDSIDTAPTTSTTTDDRVEVTTTSTEAPTTTTRPPVAAATTVLRSRERITGDITPKSVVASPLGLVIAQNMMYTHTVTAYRPDGSLAATISDGIDLARFGIAGHEGVSHGAPVEAAFTHDGRYAYVSNYSMYGDGFGPEGSDSCTPEWGVGDSYTYRIDTQTLEIDQAIEVGAVPKFVAVTPDDKTVLVTNWCTWDLSVIDAATARETARIPIGRYPRGIVVSPDSRTAYVAVMGGDVVVKVDLASRQVSNLVAAGDGPRHLLLSRDGRWLYVSHNRSGTVVRVDTGTGAVTHSVVTGQQPRSMAMSTDGSAIYVANYESSTVTKLRADDLAQLDQEPTDHHPIGIAYEPTTASVWVACYGGSILVFDDSSA